MSGPVRPPLTVETIDGATEGRPITTIKVSNGTLSVAGNVATITTDSGGSPGGTSGSIQYNDGAGGFAGSSKMLYDDTDAKITLSTGGNTLYIDAGGSPNFVMDGTGTGNIPWIIGDGGETGGTGLLISGQNNVGNQQIWFNKSANELQIKAPSSSESILINSDQGGDISITTTNGSQDILISAASGAVKLEGLTYPSSDGSPNQILQTNGSGVLSFVDAPSGSPGGSDGDLQINNSGAFGGSILSSNKTTTITLNSGASGDPQFNMTSSTKSITLTVDTNNKFKVEGALYSWELDASSASGGLTFPDGTTQTTAASGGGYPPTLATDMNSSYDMILVTALAPFSRNVLTSSTQTIDTNIYFFPFILGSDVTAVNIQVGVNTSTASTNLKLGIYNANSTTGSPSTLITNAEATIDVSTNSYKTGTLTSTTALSKNTLYYIGMCCDANSCGLRSHSSNGTIGITGLINGIDNYNKPILYDSTTTAALPSSVTTTNLITKYGFVPFIGVEIS